MMMMAEELKDRRCLMVLPPVLLSYVEKRRRRLVMMELSLLRGIPELSQSHSGEMIDGNNGDCTFTETQEREEAAKATNHP